MFSLILKLNNGLSSLFAANVGDSHLKGPAHSFHSACTFNAILTFFAFLQHFERFMPMETRLQAGR